MVLNTPPLLQPLQATGQSGFRRLTFVPATKPDAHSAPTGVDLIPLNEVPQMPALANGPRVASQGVPAAPKQQRELFRESDLILHWTTVRNRGAGYHNLGNTCFMNSVLQALAHTPPLAELFLSARGDKLVAEISGGRGGGEGHYDPVAATLELVRRSFSNLVLAPRTHAASLRLINKRFRLGRQEDSHEFLRCLLDAMHEACLKRFKPKPPPELAATTFVYRIFGGRLRSQIECEGVDYVSRTYDPFLDLSLEINRAQSLERALSAFTAPEVLDGPNKYRCPKNNKLVRAVKRISVEEAPNVLTVHFKRFEYGGFGAKINKKVDFGTQLDLRPYMSNVKGPQQLYELYGVLVHHGYSVNSGHYICYVKAANGLWHVCDDHRVTAVGERTVLDQRAYILFYVRRHPRNAAVAAAAAAAAVQQARDGPPRREGADGQHADEAALAKSGNGRGGEAGPSPSRRKREDGAGGGAEAEQQSEGQMDRAAKRARHSTPGEPAAAAAVPAVNGAKAKDKGKALGAVNASAQSPSTTLALMLANMAENKRALKLKSKPTDAGAGQGASDEQLQQPQPALKQQQQQGLEHHRGESHAAPAETAEHGGLRNGLAPPNGVKPVAVNSAGASHGALPTGSGLEQPPQQPQPLDSDSKDHSQQQHSCRSANGTHQSRPASALKPFRTSPLGARPFTSVWYAANGQLRHAGVGTAANSNGNGNGHTAQSSELRAAAASVIAAHVAADDAGIVCTGKPPRPPPSRREVDLRPAFLSQPTSPNHHADGSGKSERNQAADTLAHKDHAVKPAASSRTLNSGLVDTAAGVTDNGGDVGPSTSDRQRKAVSGLVSCRKGFGRLAAMAAEPLNKPSEEPTTGGDTLLAGSKRRRRSACDPSEESRAINDETLAKLGDQGEQSHKQRQPQQQPQQEMHHPSAAADVTMVPSPQANGTRKESAMAMPKQRQSAAAVEAVTGQDALAWLTGGSAGGKGGSGAQGASAFQRTHAKGHGAGHTDVDAGWEGVEAEDAEMRRQVAQLNFTIAGPKRHMPPGGREYDEWDQEYDRGRTKKVRSRHDEEDDGDGEEGSGRRGSLLRSGSNMFQKAASEGWRSDAKGGPGRTPGSASGSRSHGRGRGWKGYGGKSPGGGRGGRSPGARGGRFGGRGSHGRGRRRGG